MKSYLTLLLVIVPFVLFAQSNYHPGYIVKNNGDTLKGFINYREWHQNPKSIDFKVNKTDKEILRFNPQSVKEFQVTGLETYVAYTGAISMNETNFSNLPEKLDTTSKSDTLFLKQLASGRYLKLYEYTDDIKTRFFVAEVNSTPAELKYYEYYDDTHDMVNKQVFKGQLISYINKFNLQRPKLIHKLDQAHYGQTDLEQLINEVNNIDEKTTDKKNSSSRFFAGISADRTITAVSEITIAGLPTDVLHNHAAISPRINLGIDFFDNPNVQRFVFRGEIALSHVNPHYAYQIARVDGTIANATYTFNQYTVSAAPQVLYSVYNKDDFKVYLDAGIAFNVSSYANNNFAIDGSVENGYKFKPYSLVPFWLNFPLQTGVILNKKIEVCATYITKAAYSRYSGFYASNQTVSLGVKFLFSKK